MISMLKSIDELIAESEVESLQQLDRYSIQASTKNNETRAFFFTTPICNESGLVEKRFVKRDNKFIFKGSNGEITIVPEGVYLKNKACYVRIRWTKKQSFLLSEDATCLTSEELIISPTLNGISVVQVYDEVPLYFKFEAQSWCKGYPRMNSKCFAYMKEKFIPFVTVNGVYASTSDENGIAGVEMAMKKDSDLQYRLRMKSASANATKINWEINLYESKLIQDTTVESRRPNENNVYGNVAFLGHSLDHGVQYLYSRFDFDKIKVDPLKRMKRILLHVPYYIAGEQGFRVAAPFRRFCSFGSNWANKVPANGFGVSCWKEKERFVFDLTQYLLTSKGKLKENNGIVLCPSKSNGTSVLATADNYSKPQVIEIQYEKE